MMNYLHRAALLLLLPVAAAAAPDLDSAVKSDYGYLQNLYRFLHTHPELSFQEKDTSARLAGEMRGLGFAVTEHVGGYGLVAVLENGDGPTLMLRTDLDALPVEEETGLAYASTVTAVNEDGERVPVMHACGHDVHMTVWTGTARRLAALKDQWHGTLVMIGQPAEERGAGARAMLEDGLYERFPRPDFAFGMHDSADLPAGRIGYAPGYALASVDSVDVTVHGIGGHGAYPHKTKDPIVLSAEIINALQTLVSREIEPIQAGVVTVGSIHGGFKHNVIPDRVDMQLTVRSYTDETRATLLDGIRRIARGQALSAGLPDDLLPDVTLLDEHTPALYNDPALTEQLAGVLKQRFGDDRVVKVDPVMGGEDFSEYGRTTPKVPIAFFWLGAVDPERYAAARAGGPPLPSLHSAEFAPLPEPTIETGVEAMTTVALELLGR
jgi:amidohydrolase